MADIVNLFLFKEYPFVIDFSEVIEKLFWLVLLEIRFLIDEEIETIMIFWKCLVLIHANIFDDLCYV